MSNESSTRRRFISPAVSVNVVPYSKVSDVMSPAGPNAAAMKYGRPAPIEPIVAEKAEHVSRLHRVQTAVEAESVDEEREHDGEVRDAAREPAEVDVAGAGTRNARSMAAMVRRFIGSR